MVYVSARRVRKRTWNVPPLAILVRTTVGLRCGVEIRTRMRWPATNGLTLPATVTTSPSSTYGRPWSDAKLVTTSCSFPGAGLGAGVGCGVGCGVAAWPNAAGDPDRAMAAPRTELSAARRICFESTRPAWKGYARCHDEHSRDHRDGPTAVLVTAEGEHVVQGVQRDSRNDRASGLVGHAKREAQHDQRRDRLRPGPGVDDAEHEAVDQRRR